MKAPTILSAVLVFTLSINAAFAETAAEILALQTQINQAQLPQNQQDIPPEPSKDSDRPKQAGGANAAAIAGAAIAGVSCIMMLNEARKTGDKMMMMMALQQCAQAAAMAANAGQNKEAQQAAQSQSTYTPKQAAPIQLPKNEEQQVAIQAPPGEEEPEKWDFESLKSDMEVRKAEAVAPDMPVAKAKFDNPFSSLDPIPGQTSTYTDKKTGDGDGGVASSIGTGGMGQMTLAQAKALSSEELKALTASQLHSDRKGRGVASEGGEGGGSGGGGSDSSSSGGGDGSPLDAMLAQLMGGGGAGGMGAGGYGSGSDIVIFPEGNKPGGKRRTIFEFAADEYQFLAYQKGRVRTKFSSTKQEANLPTDRNTAAVTNP